MNVTRRLIWLVWAFAGLAILLGLVLILAGLHKNWIDLTIDLVRGGVILALGVSAAIVAVALSRGEQSRYPGRGPTSGDQESSSPPPTPPPGPRRA